MSSVPAPAIITIETRGTAVVARVDGMSLEDTDLQALNQGIDKAASAPGITTVVIDLAGLKMVPSLGLGGFVSIMNKCRARKQKLKLAAMSPQIRQVFTITRLDRVLELVPTVAEALE